MLRTKSVWSRISKREDGLRLLVTRFRGRGLPSSRYDVWIASLGPSERLLRSFQEGGISWSRFSRDYIHQLFMPGPVDDQNQTIKNNGEKFSLRLIKFLAQSANV